MTLPLAGFACRQTVSPTTSRTSQRNDGGKAAHRSPNTYAFVERFIQTLQQECLDYFVVFGEKHMNHLVSEMVAHYHEERPHQAKENDPLIREPSDQPKKKPKGRKASATPPDVVSIGEIKCRQRLGGLLKHYERRAG